MRILLFPHPRYARPLPQRGRCSAFTLIEILVVLVIISIITAVAVLSLTLAGTKAKAKQEANRMAMVIQFAEQQALLQTAPIALQVDTHQYQFLEFQQYAWQKMPGSIFSLYALSSGLTERIQSVGEGSDTIEAPVVFSQAGNVRPFVVEFSNNDKIYYYLSVDASGNVKSYAAQ